MHYKRANFLINKRFQLRFAFFVCTWIFALSMIYPIVIYNIFEYFLQMLSTGQVASLSLEKVKEVQNQVLFLLGILQLLFVVITFMLSVFVSHRIAGPLYKLKRAMEEAGKGNFDKKITFRKNDHFMDMQDSYNEMIQNLSIRKQR